MESERKGPLVSYMHCLMEPASLDGSRVYSSQPPLSAVSHRRLFCKVVCAASGPRQSV